MLVPLSWLREYVDIEDTVQGLRDKLTFSGLEVEGVQTFGADLPGCVVARIDAVAPHPNADKLRLCTITFGAAEPLTVVCGAPNARVGLHTVFAPAGVTLPNGLKLEKRKVRGVESAGMLCSSDELGLPGGPDGILELPETLAPGTAANAALGGPEVVFELEITPNRPDCLSILGVAREMSVLYGKPLRRPCVDFAEGAPDAPSVTVSDARCPRYTGRILRRVKVGPAPDWMQRRLTLAGVRPINNVVDITNYVMLELGQPLHAFDQSLLAEGRIVVRATEAGESILTLDGKERPLPAGTLVIADAARPVAVAGVMGGANSEIRDGTTTVLLESAAFDAPSVRATAKALDMHTESSHRFARGVDAAGADFASRRAAHLLAAHAGAEVAAGAADVYPSPAPLREVPLRWQRLRDLVGIPAPAEEITRFLESLELVTVSRDAEGAVFRIPSFRGDLEREVDLIEEYARLKGLDEIPAPPPAARIVEGADQHEYDGVRRLRHRAAAAGLSEILNYTLTAPALLDLLDPEAAGARITLPNPVSADQSVLRTSLIPQMVETLGRNKARQAEQAALFELGRVFHAGTTGPREEWHFAAGLLGPVNRDALDRRRDLTAGEVLRWVKGLLERLEPAPGVWTVEAADAPCFLKGNAGVIRQGKETVGRFGVLAPAIAREWRMNEPVGLLEFKVGDPFLRARPAAKAGLIPSLPGVQRDVALLVAMDVPHRHIEDVIRSQAPRQLESVSLFDVYTGERLQGRKSMAYSLTYRAADKTLTDDEVNALHEKLKGRLKERIPAEIVGE